VPISALPNSAFNSALAAAEPAGTPGIQLDAALREAFMYATSGAIPASPLKPIVFLLSAGNIASCQVDSAGLTENVAAGASSGALVSVIQLPSGGDPPSDAGTALLKQITSSAGTTEELVTDSTAAAVAQALVDAAAARACTLHLSRRAARRASQRDVE
jgi:hypothetical protein